MTRWHSLHVYRYPEQDLFLAHGVAPVLRPLRASGAVDRAFFLRYWQGGPHIRLRVRTDAAVVDEIAGKLRGHLAEYPSDGTFDIAAFQEGQRYMARMEDSDPHEIVPTDTVLPAEYEPEYGKYGGHAGVAIAEDLFDASTTAVLGALAQLDGRSARRLGVAFDMMLRGLAAVGRSPAGMADFFAYYCRLWSPYVFGHFSATWTELLARQGPPMTAHAGRLLATGSLTDDWSAAVRTAWQAVAEHTDTVLPHVTLAGPDAPPERRRQALLANYLHTNNNRMGVNPESEAYLAYLGHHVLSDCAGTPIQTGLESVAAHGHLD